MSRTRSCACSSGCARAWGEWRDYLDAPLPGDRGAHGPFDDEAKTHGIQLMLAKARSLLRR